MDRLGDSSEFSALRNHVHTNFLSSYLLESQNQYHYSRVKSFLDFQIKNSSQVGKYINTYMTHVGLESFQPWVKPFLSHTASYILWDQ